MKLRSCLLPWSLLLVSTLAVAEPIQNHTAATSTTHVSPHEPSATQRSEEQRAHDWGLRSDEWARYRELMDGPLGIHSPNIDPLTALGIEARSDDERRRYAEMQVRIEARRVERLLAYQRAYDDAWQRLYPGMERVGALDSGLSSPVEDMMTDRPAVFVKDACTACDATVQRLQAAGTAFDIYVVGSRADDERIRAWARRIGLDPAKVRSGHITLNHDSGRWLTLAMPGELPAVMRRVGNQWQRQP